MTTEAPIVSITGVLKRPNVPDWIPHDTLATESEAVDAIIHHMEGDALCHFDPVTGPVHWHDKLECWHAWGNSFLCSAGFEICPLSEESRTRLLAAWESHRKSRHFAIVAELNALSNRMEEALEAVPKPRGSYNPESVNSPIRAPFLRLIKPLEAELESILRTNMAKG